MSTDTRSQPVTFGDLLHTARQYIRATASPPPAPRPRWRAVATWEALEPLQRAGYEYERIADHLERLRRLTETAQTRRADRAAAAAFMDALLPALEDRRREHGHAYVTWREAQRLNRYGLRQPGHTRYRYSTPSEDLSDAAQLGTPEAQS